MAMLMLSLAGIPPLAGFIGKYYAFWAAVEAGLTVFAVLGVIASVIGAYYYLRIAKTHLFRRAGRLLRADARDAARGHDNLRRLRRSVSGWCLGARSSQQPGRQPRSLILIRCEGRARSHCRLGSFISRRMRRLPPMTTRSPRCGKG